MKLYINILLFFLTQTCFSQLVTSSGQSPVGLVQNVLLGPGVTVSNITYNGSPSAIGYFDGSQTNLGIDSGIVLTTGTVLQNGSGPHGPNDQAGAGVDNGTAGSGLLSSIINGSPTFNASILEFDFIPYSDTVRFKYVFGSDEYPEFAPPNNSGFNDVFGFFISGPGVPGMMNIARLPTNGSIVSINNVNAITNSAFFIPNGDGSTAPQNSSPTYIQYDGFTQVLEAVSQVQCGETYHLIIAVSDVGDGEWDSGIFLQANSLSSANPIDINYSISQQVFLDSTWMAEGCVDATVTVERQQGSNTALTIPIQLSGTATNGVDYTGVPANVTFNPGQTSVSFTINVINDALAEGLESLIMSFMIQDPCGNMSPIDLELQIQDVMPVDVVINGNQMVCPGDDVTLNASTTGGVSPYTYIWSTGSTSSSITVSPTVSTTYSVSVTDNCLNQTVTTDYIVNVPILDTLHISTSGDVVEICPNVLNVLYADAIGGAQPYSYIWTVNSQVVGLSDSLIVTPNYTTTYIVEVSDICGNTDSDSIIYTVVSPPLSLTMTPMTQTCPGDSVLLSVFPSGGYGNYYYTWTHNGASTQSITVAPLVSTTYEVIVTDDCQTMSVSGLTQIEVIKPNADFSIISSTLYQGIPITFQNLSSNGTSYDWLFGDGMGSQLTHPNHVYSDAGSYFVTLIAEDANGCLDSIVKPITIEEEFYIYIPNTFIPDNDRINETFSGSFIGVSGINMEIYNRWGELIFESDDINFEWDGLYRGKMVIPGTYIWRLSYARGTKREYHLTGHISVIR